MLLLHRIFSSSFFYYYFIIIIIIFLIVKVTINDFLSNIINICYEEENTKIFTNFLIKIRRVTLPKSLSFLRAIGIFSIAKPTLTIFLNSKEQSRAVDSVIMHTSLDTDILRGLEWDRLSTMQARSWDLFRFFLSVSEKIAFSRGASGMRRRREPGGFLRSPLFICECRRRRTEAHRAPVTAKNIQTIRGH